MLTGVAGVAIMLVLGMIFIPESTMFHVPIVNKVIPVSMVLMFCCGLCTSVMWGSIFNLAAEGLGKYTPAASGIFMALVCGGGVIPFVQNLLADCVGFMQSYWVIIICLAYLLFYALIGSKNVNKDIPVD